MQPDTTCKQSPLADDQVHKRWIIASGVIAMALVFLPIVMIKRFSCRNRAQPAITDAENYLFSSRAAPTTGQSAAWTPASWKANPGSC